LAGLPAPTTLRNGIVAQEPNVVLEGTVECDEVYVVAGRKGHPESVKKNAANREAFLALHGNRTG
jgi:hypothetical protein